MQNSEGGHVSFPEKSQVASPFPLECVIFCQRFCLVLGTKEGRKEGRKCHSF